VSAVSSLFQKTVSGVRGTAAALALICYAYMCGAVLIQILGRYLFDFRIAEWAETATFAQVWLGVLGAGIAMRRGAIFAIEVLPAMLPLLPARILRVIIVIASLSFLGVVSYGGLILIEDGFFQTSSTMLIPMWIVYFPIPIGMAYFGFETIMRAVEYWDAPFDRPHAETEETEEAS
jgi:TRAP-type C4-dicarboxylate transport system permease small subunit